MYLSIKCFILIITIDYKDYLYRENMDTIRKTYKTLIVIIILVTGIAISAIYMVTIHRIEGIHQESTAATMVQIKKDFLKDNVDNLILAMDTRRENLKEYYDAYLVRIQGILAGYQAYSSPEAFLGQTREFFDDPVRRASFSVLILDTQGNQPLYQINLPEDFSSMGKEPRTDYLETEMSGYYEKLYGRYRVLVGVPSATIDTAVKEEVYQQIHNSQYSQDSYIWVNQIINYEGGENYGIRLIHPNLKDTEGSYLSTATEDVMGGTPYLTELEGVRDHGSIFYQYHFKKLNSDMISEKVAYARLYPDYDWIIAMGIHLDDIDAYVEKTLDNSHRAIFGTLITSLVIIAGLMALATFTTSRMEKWYFNRSYNRLMKEAYRDSLTGIFNRKAGEQFLHSSFEKFGLSGVDTAVLILDLDDFKKINDHCGHQRGDEVLIQFAQAVGNSLRSTDVLVRWGGEEFLLICEGLKSEDTRSFTDKILEAARTVTYTCSDDQIQVLTTSIGLSFFHPMDKGPDEAVRRADEAMYEAKAKGKNQASEK